jgi:hypothetical protein
MEIKNSLHHIRFQVKPDCRATSHVNPYSVIQTPSRKELRKKCGLSNLFFILKLQFFKLTFCPMTILQLRSAEFHSTHDGKEMQENLLCKNYFCYVYRTGPNFERFLPKTYHICNEHSHGEQAMKQNITLYLFTQNSDTWDTSFAKFFSAFMINSGSNWDTMRRAIFIALLGLINLRLR